MIRVFQILLVLVSLALLTGNDSLGMDAWRATRLLFFDFLEVFIREDKLILARWLVHQRDVQLVPQVSVAVELNPPTKLIAKNLCDFKVGLNLGGEDSLKVFLVGEPVDSRPLFVVKLA
jgi:hypothetical protein